MQFSGNAPARYIADFRQYFQGEMYMLSVFKAGSAGLVITNIIAIVLFIDNAIKTVALQNKNDQTFA